MAKIQFGEWLPDQPGIAGAITDALNCYPVANGYAPLNLETTLSNAAPESLMVAFGGKANGTVSLFAGSATKLYKFDPSNMALNAVSSAYTATTYWDSVQFGSRMIAANGINKLQSIDIVSGVSFADLSASAPIAKYVTVVRDFVVAANIGALQNKVQWSDINDETNWTPSSTSQADNQILPDGGDITGLAGGEYGLVFLERAIYRMSYVGSPLFFQFDAISRTLGCTTPGSIAQFGGKTYFLADDGFYVTDGQSFKNIGEEKVNRYFFKTALRSGLTTAMSSAVDPIKKLVVWCYPTQSGATELLIYSIANDKFTRSVTTATSIASLLSATVTLEGLDNYSSSLDALQISLDDPIWAGGGLIFAGTAGARLLTFGGQKKTAEIVTGDIDAGRSVVTLARPLVDGGSGSVAVASRGLLNDQVIFGASIPADLEGRVSLRSAGRYHRLKVIPSGDNWATAVGVDVTVTPQGAR